MKTTGIQIGNVVEYEDKPIIVDGVFDGLFAVGDVWVSAEDCRPLPLSREALIAVGYNLQDNRFTGKVLSFEWIPKNRVWKVYANGVYITFIQKAHEFQNLHLAIHGS